MLRIVLPKGSLERATLELFEAADLAVREALTSTTAATIDDPRIDEVRILRPQEIPLYVAEGMFDLGITGRDWIEETAAEVVSLGELEYSKATRAPSAHRRRDRRATLRSSGSRTCRRACESPPSTRA